MNTYPTYMYVRTRVTLTSGAHVPEPVMLGEVGGNERAVCREQPERVVVRVYPL